MTTGPGQRQDREQPSGDLGQEEGAITHPAHYQLDQGRAGWESPLQADRSCDNHPSSFHAPSWPWSSSRFLPSPSTAGSNGCRSVRTAAPFGSSSTSSFLSSPRRWARTAVSDGNRSRELESDQVCASELDCRRRMCHRTGQLDGLGVIGATNPSSRNHGTCSFGWSPPRSSQAVASQPRIRPVRWDIPFTVSCSVGHTPQIVSLGWTCPWIGNHDRVVVTSLFFPRRFRLRRSKIPTTTRY